ncbi:hypothetical protein GO013_12880 [Pseudodesulfovibrio sp. JC047]|uniref:hypothetical protein n=1 Tax=Pseudodesulfovibrio sp. JC047 TaxID=2683199 RepID=UPI0013D53CC8|nr:hypothetical protein [Pseudodesulfovibrio sp. JC047]NDV20303.1 hypothetical protein [Pseudodesulfovibrio sp. JC047]
MKFRIFLAGLLLFLAAIPALANEPDYLAMMAHDSEIKAIATISKLRRVSGTRNGTFTHVSFKRVYALTPYTPKVFVGACKILNYAWQKRSEGIIYLKPKVGQKVYVTVSSDGGAITSFTLLTPELNYAVRKDPARVEYTHGKAVLLPSFE